MRWIVGIDEVGRGALAGPVVVAAAAVPAGWRAGKNAPPALRDSKKLSARQRGEWVSYFAGRAEIRFALARVYPRRIERLNISNAANEAAERAFTRLAAGARLGPRTPVFLDGGLFLGKKRQGKYAKTLVRADETIDAVKIASIAAKVYRDRIMARLSKRHPRYGFGAHKGYGTAAHLRAIKKFGPSPVHRLTFLP